MYLTSTQHCAISAHRLITAIIDHDGLGSAAHFISNLGETMQVVRLVLLFVDMFIGDLVIVSNIVRLLMSTCTCSIRHQSRHIVYG